MNRIYCSVRRAPVAEDIPDDPVVALLREEGDGRLPFMRPARATRPSWCYDRLGAHPGGVKLVNLTSSHLARKMARRDKRHRRSGRPVVQHDIQKTRFVKNMQRKRPACEATAEGCTPEQMERWAGIQ